VKFQVKNEYVDRVLGRRIRPGEELELSVERVNAIKALGVGLEPTLAEPAIEKATAPPKVEKAVKADAPRPRSPKA
jgi:hypothetical protein